MYERFREYLFNDVIENTKIKYTFDNMKDTAVYERYLLNVAQFSAAKCDKERIMLQEAVYNDKKEIKSYSQFVKDAEKITDISQKTWLRVERDMCVRQSVQAEQFLRMIEDKDLYPYWVYKGVMDDKEREEHVALEDKVFRIGDPEGDACFPPNDWNCRCSGEPIDDDELKDKGLKVSTNAEAKEFLDKNVDEDFRYNPSSQGPLPNEGEYFNEFPSANASDANYLNYDENETE